MSVLTGLLAAQTVAAAGARDAARPVGQLLNPDGTLDVSAGYSGSLDISGYDVHLDSAHGPVFRPLMTTNAWSALGSGLNGIVYAIAINGTDIYAGGQFTDAGGNPNADRVAKWDGSSWSALGSGISNGQVESLAFNGALLYVGGTFTDAGGNTSADYIAQWDGASWSTLGGGLSNTVHAIGVSGSNIYVAGSFTNAGGDANADFIAKLDGGTWAALGATPLNQPVFSIVVAGSTVYAGGDFSNVGGNPNLTHIAQWDGVSWSPMGSGLNSTVLALALSGGEIYAGGFFTDAGGNTNADKIAKWDGSSWSALGGGLNSFVSAIAASGSNLYVGGNFFDAGGNANADYIARWDGSSWSALGTTPLNSGGNVTAIAMSGLDLYAGGNFFDAGGNSNADRIALFQIDGTAPTVASFAATSQSNSLNIPITAFSASDNVGVTGYKITESSTPPAASDSGWTASAPTTYTVAGNGSYMLYPWAKDATGNISAVYGSPASVFVDATAPTVNSFAATSPSTSHDIPIIDFTASDADGVSGYLITTSATPPSAGAAGWTASAPATYTVAGLGSYTLYPWAKDATGNVSAVYGSPAAVMVCIPGTLTVTSSADSGAGTLRQAIADACPDATIVFDSALSGATIRLNSSLTLSKNVTIDGSGLSSQVTINGDSDNNGTGNVRVFYVTGGGTTKLDSLIVTKGRANIGGGIYNDHNTLTVINSTVSNSSATAGLGGGVYNEGTLAVVNTTIVGNTSNTDGGGLYNSDGTMTVTNSTISGNSAAWGGGITTDRNTLTITNSTISGNSAINGHGGNVDLQAGTLNYANTIIANAISGGDCLRETGSIGINTNNLVEDGSCSASLSGDPNLDVLANNGGSTQTLALLPGSKAIDAGDDATCASAPVGGLDQRGITRPSGPHCDIGAYEYVDTSAPSVTSFSATSPSTSFNIAITAFTASDDVTVNSYLITQSATPPSAGAAGWTASAPSTYTVAGNGSYTLYPWAKDAAGNVSAVYGSPVSVTVDATAPAVDSFTLPSLMSTYDIPITAFTGSDNVAVTGYLITLSSTQPSANDGGWTASAPTTYTVLSDGSYTLYPWAMDAAGNVSAVYGSPASVTVETTAPTVISSELINNNPTNAASVDFIVTFSEGVSGVDISDFTLTASGVTGASITGVSGSGATRIISVNTGSGDGTIRLDVLDDDSIQDDIGNALNGGLTSGQSYTIDKTAPTVVSSVRTNASPTSAASVHYIVTFSELVTGVDATDFSLLTSGGSDAYVSAVSGSGAIYTVSVNAGSASATIRLEVLDDDSVIDLAGNTQSGDLTSGESYTIDKTAPTVVSSTRANANPTNAASVDFIVTFGESVTGVDTSDFSLTSSGVTGASISGVSGGPKLYTVSVNAGSGSGTLRLDLLDDDSIADSAGNPLGGSGLANGNFSTGEMYTIDKIAPTAGSLVAPNVTLSGGTTYSFTVTFSDNLAIAGARLGTGDIRVTGPGGFNQLATLVQVAPAGNGTPRTATYQITAPGASWDSVDSGTYSVALEANQVFDSAGNSVSAGSLGSFLVKLNYSVYLPLVQR